VLLAGSGLMLRSLGNLLGIDPGFRADRVLSLRLNPSEQTRRDSLPPLLDQLLDRVQGMPGVEAAGLADCPPLAGGCNVTVAVLRDRPEGPPGTNPQVGVHWISPSWPAVLGVPLLRGRRFGPEDRSDTRKVVLVNREAARKLWPGQDPIGKPLNVYQGGFDRDTAYVVGVVGDVRFGTLEAGPTPDVYLSYRQSPRGRLMLFVRTAGDPAGLVRPVTDVVRQIAPDFAISDTRPMTARVADAAAQTRFSAVLLALFAAVALALAALGIYGVISFAVAARTREIGIRAALGADRSRLLRMVVGQGLLLALIGGALGLAIALASTRLLRSLLYEVAPTDPVTFAAVIVPLGLAAIVASWLPARRAARVAPLEALRDD
jgi:predicted permease